MPSAKFKSKAILTEQLWAIEQFLQNCRNGYQINYLIYLTVSRCRLGLVYKKCLLKLFYWWADCSSRKFKEFNFKDIEMLVNEKQQPWFKKAHVGKFLGISNTHTSTTKLGQYDMQTHTSLQTGSTIHTMGS